MHLCNNNNNNNNDDAITDIMMSTNKPEDVCWDQTLHLSLKKIKANNSDWSTIQNIWMKKHCHGSLFY